MDGYALPLLLALFLWWFSTLVILVLNHLATRTYSASMAVATLLAASSVAGLYFTRGVSAPWAVYVAFSSGLLIWGWLQMGFYMGYLAGPRRVACDARCRGGWRHFLHAVGTSLNHEVAITVVFLGIAAMTWNESNRFGLLTYIVLWGMHVSAKLNMFFGVRNLNADFLPGHLRYLESYLRERPMNPVFPVSVTAGTLLAAYFVNGAFQAGPQTFEGAGHVLLATLTVLAVAEHWFLVLPIRADRLWRFGIGDRASRARKVEYPPDGTSLLAPPGR